MGHLAATSYTVSSGGSGFAVFLFIGLALYVLTALGLYGTFVKAGQPGWAGFVPFYNFIILLKVAGRPTSWGWFLLLLIVPYLGTLAFFVIYIIVANDVSKSFGHGPGFTVGLVIPYVSVIFYYILWLGSSVYRGPAAAMGATSGGYPPAGGYYPPQTGLPAPARLPTGRSAGLPTGRPGPAPTAARLPAGRPGPAPTTARLPSGRTGPAPTDAPRRTPGTPGRTRADASAPVASGRQERGWGQLGGVTASRAEGTASRVARMASARARAEVGSSSMATRSPGPRDGLIRSMLRVCSGRAWTGWSK